MIRNTNAFKYLDQKFFNVTLVFRTALASDNHEFNEFIKKRGDAIRDIAFEVDDVKSFCKRIAD